MAGVVWLVLGACQSDRSVPARGSDRFTPSDPHTFATETSPRVQHLSLELTVQFETRTLQGSARLDLARAAPSAGRLVLDTSDLSIEQIRCESNGTALPYQLAAPHPVLGRALNIDLSTDCPSVRIDYRTSPDAEALLWLDPEATPSKRAPMLFTQSQSIYARSWVPIQDSPGIRFTFDATVRVPGGSMVLMSAANPASRAPDGVYFFSMRQPVPAYLLALAVGDFEFRPIGARTGVYADPTVIDAAQYELAEVESMLEAAERMWGPYRWDRYDCLVLPASFPFGGMENPRLTFLTPTILAGDRSLVSLLAHELAHAWSGNLVTAANWNELWLNEGMTTYLERRLMESLRGREYSEMLAAIGRQDLDSSLQRLGPNETLSLLRTRLGRDASPEDLPTEVAYEKGYLLLGWLEQKVGRERFDRFLKQRFDRLAFGTSDTEQFVTDLERELFAGQKQQFAALGLERWFDQPGLPVDAPLVTSRRFAQIDLHARAVGEGVLPNSEVVKAWSTHEWIRFIRSLPPALGPEQLAALDQRFSLTTTANAEIAMNWLPVCIKARYAPAKPAIERYLLGVGRRRNIRPIYQALVDRGEPEQRWARELFERAALAYHPLTRAGIEPILAAASAR